MPPPYVGLKPYAPRVALGGTTDPICDGASFDVDEYELAQSIEPGLDRIAETLIDHLERLLRGKPHSLSRTLLDGNPAWPRELSEAAQERRLDHDPLVVICPLALSRTQDDKGNDRWTLFGTSHDGAVAASMHGVDEAALAQLLNWAGLDGEWAVFADDAPTDLRGRLLIDAPVASVQTLVTFVPFAALPAAIRAAYLAGELVLVPSPASLMLFEHPRYRELARELRRASQIPLLHLFPRVEDSFTIRIPQAGWFEEKATPRDHGHRIVDDFIRTHRWQRVRRDANVAASRDYRDKVATTLFSTSPEDVELYSKPLARNSQIWTEDYRLLLDGTAAQRAQIQGAASAVGRGGRFGYRMYYPPMRVGARETFWHLPLVAHAGRGRYARAPLGYVTAEAAEDRIVMQPHLLRRPVHLAAARAFPNDPGHSHHTTSHNIRKLLDTRHELDEPLAPAHARALLHIAKELSLEDWLAALPAHAADAETAAFVGSALREATSAPDAPGTPLVLDQLGTRAFAEQVWTTIAELAHGAFRQKNDADGISVNRGKHGGRAGKAAGIHTRKQRDLEALGDHLHARYRALIAAHDMVGRADVLDHVFRWETDFEFPWMEGWAKNQQAPAQRNIVLVIPGKDRTQAVVMADHYDTAYMEDVYYPEEGGDLLRAPAFGADDNHSATTALLLAAERLLPLAHAGTLERDVWLVHLTGEEYPADCLGARALCQALVERTLQLTGEDGRAHDMSSVDVVAAFVLDMIGHNLERDRDVFQIAPGEGAASSRLARRAHHANLRWNRCAAEWNLATPKLGRAERMPDGSGASPPPPPFAQLAVHGEVRLEWDPRSALFNTDGQIFSDVGVPVVLFMENYDIRRTGYHDTHDTMANIDLDYCVALMAIAIETVAETASAR